MDEDSANEWLLKLLPGVVLAFYIWFVWSTYSQLLNWDLTFKSPELAGPPEDVLGAGFVPTWLVFSLFFLVALCAALFGAKRRVRFGIAWIVLFGSLSALDFFLHETVMRQILAM
jgi:hypothetical protein